VTPVRISGAARGHFRGAAELAAARVPALWTGSAVAALPVGAAEERAVVTGDGDTAVVRLTRLAARTAWAAAESRVAAPSGPARRAVATLFTLTTGPDSAPVLVPVTRRAWSHTY
jgi:hypothetical protein